MCQPWQDSSKGFGKIVLSSSVIHFCPITEKDLEYIKHSKRAGSELCIPMYIWRMRLSEAEFSEPPFRQQDGEASPPATR